MSRWAPSPKTLPQSQESGLDRISSAAEEGSGNPIGKPEVPARSPWWARFVPYFLSAFFFLSAFLAIFAPLPLLFFHVRKGRGWAWFAVLTNGIIVTLAGGGLSLVFYIVFVAILSMTLAELVKRKFSLEKAAIFTLLAMALSALAFAFGYAHLHHANLILEIQSQVSSFVDYLGQSVTSGSSLVNPSDVDEWKRSLLVEFPSAIAIFSLVLVWANLVLLLKVNPNGVRESLGLDAHSLKKWKTPEYLVWPTIFTGFFLVVDMGIASDVALNVFKFLMAIYAIQGLSILSYFFDLWGVRGFFRLLGFSLSVFLMMPLVLSLGFFDLWFDFRGKFRQS